MKKTDLKPGQWFTRRGFRLVYETAENLGLPYRFESEVCAYVEGQPSWRVVSEGDIEGWAPFRPRPPRRLLVPSWLVPGATIHWWDRTVWKDQPAPINCTVWLMRWGWVLTRNVPDGTLWFWTVADILKHFKPLAPVSRFDRIIVESG